ncbi:hypothetical protein Ciccas_003422 [Cichlidogyrus casuarinus]|uniref:Secreted protein n=1 Tax=Cichlidogyrus casuarinus TaxID=1844966 RepID=A0ABD2QEK8_9PLAT
MLRVMLTVLSSITFLVGAEKLHLTGAGALACLCFSFTVAAGWRGGYPWKLVTVAHKCISEKVEPDHPALPVEDAQIEAPKDKETATRSISLPVENDPNLPVSEVPKTTTNVQVSGAAGVLLNDSKLNLCCPQSTLRCMRLEMTSNE